MYATIILFDYLNIIVILCTIYLCLIKIHTYILPTNISAHSTVQSCWIIGQLESVEKYTVSIYERVY